jgi:hypothetical protein
LLFVLLITSGTTQQHDTQRERSQRYGRQERHHTARHDDGAETERGKRQT